jgi:UDP-glucose 4-epimerase
MRILITGGAGFIGSNLARFLTMKDHKVRVIDNLSTGKMENLNEIIEKIDFFEVDITEEKSLERTFKDIDYVIHLAAVTSVQKSLEEPDLTFKVNIEGTNNILKFSEKLKVRKIIFASSCAIYGNPKILPVPEDSEFSPLSPYAESKINGEKLCFEFLKKGIDIVILRFFNVFGPKQDADSPYSGVISKFIKKILKGERPIIYGDGEQTRDFVYVDDVLSAVEKALLSKAVARVFNIGSGKRYSVNQIFEILKRISDFKEEPEYKEERKGEVRHTLADISRARIELGWKPEISIEEGLKRTFEYIKGGKLNE